jgi:beta-glucanase (GH16 family)
VHLRRTQASAVVALTLAALLAGCGPDAPAEPENKAPQQTQGDTSTAPKSPQTASLSMLPQISGAGGSTQPADRALSAMTATFTPALAGRTVTLQRKASAGWEAVGTAEQDQRGVVEFSAASMVNGATPVYRATAAEVDGYPQKSTQPARTDAAPHQDWTEEFDGSTLDGDWTQSLQGYSVESKRACSKADPRAVTIGGGVAQLDVQADPLREGETCTTQDGEFPYRLNGRISTEGRRSFTYGHFAARIKFQSHRGQHGAFWMQPQSQSAATGDATKTGAEIDVIEWFGEDQPQGGLTSFVYSLPYSVGRKYGGFIRKPEQFGRDWARRYHVFSVEWTPQEYVFRIDGKETFRTDQAVSGRPQYLILSLLSSDYELKFLEDDGNLPQSMKVDWVRHWPLS